MFYTNSLSLRKKGKLTFEDLNEEECLNYIKYSISNIEDSLSLVSSLGQEYLSNPNLTSHILQKVS